MTTLPSVTRVPTLPPPPRATITRARPSRAGYVWAVVVAMVGVSLGAFWGVTAYTRMQDRIDGFARSAIPGEVSLFVEEPDGRVIYYEGRGEMSLPALDVRVTAPWGARVPVEAYGADLRYDGPGDAVGQAVGTFDAAATGRYTVQTLGTAPAGAALAVGGSIPASTLAAIVAAGLLVLGSLGAAVLLVIVTAIRRH